MQEHGLRPQPLHDNLSTNARVTSEHVAAAASATVRHGTEHVPPHHQNAMSHPPGSQKTAASRWSELAQRAVHQSRATEDKALHEATSGAHVPGQHVQGGPHDASTSASKEDEDRKRLSTLLAKAVRERKRRGEVDASTPHVKPTQRATDLLNEEYNARKHPDGPLGTGLTINTKQTSEGPVTHHVAAAANDRMNAEHGEERKRHEAAARIQAVSRGFALRRQRATESKSAETPAQSLAAVESHHPNSTAHDPAHGPAHADARDTPTSHPHPPSPHGAHADPMHGAHESRSPSASPHNAPPHAVHHPKVAPARGPHHHAPEEVDDHAAEAVSHAAAADHELRRAADAVHPNTHVNHDASGHKMHPDAPVDVDDPTALPQHGKRPGFITRAQAVLNRFRGNSNKGRGGAEYSNDYADGGGGGDAYESRYEDFEQDSPRYTQTRRASSRSRLGGARGGGGGGGYTRQGDQRYEDYADSTDYTDDGMQYPQMQPFQTTTGTPIGTAGVVNGQLISTNPAHSGGAVHVHIHHTTVAGNANVGVVQPALLNHVGVRGPCDVYGTDVQEGVEKAAGLATTYQPVVAGDEDDERVARGGIVYRKNLGGALGFEDVAVLPVLPFGRNGPPNAGSMSTFELVSSLRHRGMAATIMHADGKPLTEKNGEPDPIGAVTLLSDAGCGVSAVLYSYALWAQPHHPVVPVQAMSVPQLLHWIAGHGRPGLLAVAHGALMQMRVAGPPAII